jgi:hypothetical protein
MRRTVTERGERDRSKLATLQPVDSGGIDGNGFFCRDIGTGKCRVLDTSEATPPTRDKNAPVLQVRVLTLLLRFEVKPGEASEVFLADGLVNRGTSTDTLSVVMSNRGPPIGLALHIAENN